MDIVLCTADLSLSGFFERESLTRAGKLWESTANPNVVHRPAALVSGPARPTESEPPESEL